MGEGNQDQAALPAVHEVANRGWDTRVRMFRAGDDVDTFAVVTRRYVVLVDTTGTPEQAVRVAEVLRPEMAGRGLLVVNTHADWDHCWGNSAFAAEGPYPAPILGHELALERLLGEEAQRKLADKQARESRFGAVRLVAPDVTFRDGLRITGGDLTLELVPTPGHTPDHVSVWIPEIRLLLAGDAAEHPFPYVHAAAELPALLDSLRRLEALGADVTLPCHGGTSDPGLPARNLAYFAAVKQHARAVLNGSGLPEDWERRDDLPALVGYPYEEAVRAVGAEPEDVPGFYRVFHAAAVRAAVGSLEVGSLTAGK
jgi:glyoxylase-like metal-dependent hydrolase (beta-lactamase superfamily II)